MIKLSNDKGFSLAEIMVAAGLLGVVSLGVMKLTKNQSVVQKRAESSFEVNTLSSNIAQVLLNSTACSETLGVGSIITEGTDLSEIKNRRGDAILNKVDKYGNNQIKISSLKLENLNLGPLSGTSKYGEVNLVVIFEKLSKVLTGAKTIAKSFPLRVELDASDKLKKCYSSTENAIATAKKEVCSSIEGVFDEATDNCNLAEFNAADPLLVSKAVSTQSLSDFFTNKETMVLDPKYVDIAGDTMTGKLQVDADIESSSKVCINGNCRETFADQSCSVGEVVRQINSSGTLACSNLSCADGKLLAGVGPAGAPICISLNCPENFFLTGVTPAGVAICKAIESVEPKNCAWTAVSYASRPGWASASCPSGKILKGHYFKTTNNKKENMEVQITWNKIMARRVNDGSGIWVKAYCCDL